MRAALAEGRKARSICLPNPPVGCVIVANGEIISRGHTNLPGADHAEAMALRALKQDNFAERPLTVYVTLEPCAFHGRTPSCALALANWNIEHVYVGMLDPDPRNNGKGITILQAAGISVTVGVLLQEVEADLAPFLLQSH